MRKIKFRGKIKYTQRWIDGYLWLGCNEAFYIKTEELDEFGSTLKDFEVFPETVGQFTGLTDKNGKEIYEGDVLEYDTGKRYVVVYSTEGLDSNTNDFYIGAFMLKDDHNFHELICSVTRPYRYAEIIGSIHDIPELLNEKQ